MTPQKPYARTFFLLPFSRLRRLAARGAFRAL